MLNYIPIEALAMYDIEYTNTINDIVNLENINNSNNSYTNNNKRNLRSEPLIPDNLYFIGIRFVYVYEFQQFGFQQFGLCLSQMNIF